MVARRIDFSQVLSNLRLADFRLIALGSGLLVAAWISFAFRWQILLGGVKPIPVPQTFSSIMIGYFANTFLPLRLGDLVRIALVNRRHERHTGEVVGSVALERTLDILTLLSMAAVLSLVVPIHPLIRSALFLFSVLGLGALAALLLLAHWKPGAAVPSKGRHIGHYAASGLRRVASGLSVLRNIRQTILTVCWSLLGWAAAGMAMSVYADAFHLPVPWYAGFFVLVVVNLGATIPSSPGFIGVYHYLVVLALSAWLANRNLALAFAIGTHAVNLLLTIALGGYCLTRESLGLGSVVRLSEGVRLNGSH